LRVQGHVLQGISPHQMLALMIINVDGMLKSNRKSSFPFRWEVKKHPL